MHGEADARESGRLEWTLNDDDDDDDDDDIGFGFNTALVRDGNT